MSSLLTTYTITTVVLVLCVCIPMIVKGVTWIINLVKKHKSNQQEAFEAGYEAAEEDEAIEERFCEGEEFMQKLEKRETDLEQIMKDQQEQIGLLRQEIKNLSESDNLNIKHDIKKAWVRVVQLGHSIDYQDLEVLNARYAIYAARGGNSWAKTMMDEINKRATITSPYNQEQDK